MTEIDSEKIIKRANIHGSKIGDELVFFNHEAGKYYGTGAVGAEIWDILEKPTSFSQICDQLLEKFDVDRDTCETHVGEFISEMLKSGILDSDT